MSEHLLKYRYLNHQDTTPKRVFVQQQSFTQPYLNQSPIYHTPDRAIKAPFKNPNQSVKYNDMSDFLKRIPTNPQYPPTYQSSQISIQQELNNTSKMFEQNKKRNDYSPITQDHSQILLQKINNLSQLNQQSNYGKQKEFSQFYENSIQITDRNPKPKWEDKMAKQSDIEKIKQLLMDQSTKLNQQLEEYKQKVNQQDNKLMELDRTNKQLKQQLKDKQQEVINIKQTYISQQKMQECFETQLREFQKTYKQLAAQNDELTEENNQLKMLMLQADNYSSISRSIISKKNSEQEFQVSHTDNVKELIDQFITGGSDQLLTLTQDPMIQNVFFQFREIIHGLQAVNNHDLVASGDFMKIKQQSEDIISVPELQQKAEHIIKEIQQKMEQMAALKDGDQRKNQIKQEIDKLQKEYEGIQILVTEQSDYLDKNQANIHRNSIISFDQNFDGDEHY